MFERDHLGWYHGLLSEQQIAPGAADVAGDSEASGRAEGAKIRRQPIPPATVQQAAQLYESGATIAELAKRFGVAHNTLRLRLIDAGVVMRGRGGRGLARDYSESSKVDCLLEGLA